MGMGFPLTYFNTLPLVIFGQSKNKVKLKLKKFSEPNCANLKAELNISNYKAVKTRSNYFSRSNYFYIKFTNIKDYQVYFYDKSLKNAKTLFSFTILEGMRN